MNTNMAGQPEQPQESALTDVCSTSLAGPSEQPAEDIPQGTRRVVDGQKRTYFYGYWIKAYDPPTNTLKDRKRLIEGLTRRLFNHVEHGLNIPGRRLNEARAAYDRETDPKRKRVKAAMLAGTLFNRAADVFTKLVEMQELGIEVGADSALMNECGGHLLEALSLGKMVLHRSGEEGIDELWGEPFKAFTVPLEVFYESRYVKIALTMRDIDRLVSVMTHVFGDLPVFAGLAERLQTFGCAAKIKCETLRTDQDVFEMWTTFVVAGEEVVDVCSRAADPSWSAAERQGYRDASSLVSRGRDLLSDITRARTPMPKSAKDFIEKCEHFRNKYGALLLSTHFREQTDSWYPEI